MDRCWIWIWILIWFFDYLMGLDGVGLRRGGEWNW